MRASSFISQCIKKNGARGGARIEETVKFGALIRRPGFGFVLLSETHYAERSPFCTVLK